MLMSIDEIMAVVKRPTFEPFSVEMSDGSSYPVLHPDMILLSRRSVHVGVSDGVRDEVAQRIVICDPLHITRLIPLDSKSNGRRKKK